MPELYEFYSTVGLRFREVVEKIEERGKKTNLKNLQNMAGKNSRPCKSGAKLQKYYNFLKF